MVYIYIKHELNKRLHDKTKKNTGKHQRYPSAS